MTINDKPTCFIEKIWESLIGIDITPSTYREYHEKYQELFRVCFDGYHKAEMNPKNHTLREDKTDRWKAGRDIHFVINNRTPLRFQFAPVVPCISVQKVEFLWSLDKWDHRDGSVAVLIDEKEVGGACFINGELQSSESEFEIIKTLARNDGFDTAIDFLRYFDHDWSGKIIHWTDYKY